MSRRIYVAGGSSERDMVSTYMDSLRGAGWTIAHDWTQDPVFVGGPPQDSARLDYQGVWNSDYVWVILPREKSEGAFFEFGAACSARDAFRESDTDRRLTIVVSGFDATRDAARIFVQLADKVCPSHSHALGWLLVQS